MAKLFQIWIGAGLLLANMGALSGPARAQDLTPPDPGPPGMVTMPSRSSEPDALRGAYAHDPLMLRTLHEQAHQRAEERQKQIVDATNLLLKIAQSLRNEMASHPGAFPGNTETERLEQIRKLARTIQDREKTEDDVPPGIAKTGVWQ